MSLESLQDLLVSELRDLHNAEKQLVKALPKMAKAASNARLQAAFETHLRETEAQAERLEEIFDALGERATGRKCKAMEGLVEEGREMIDEEGDDDVRDAGLIAAAQRVEHYEMAAYGCAITYSKMLGYDDIASKLGQSLDEEKAADENLTRIAESEVNTAAMEAGAKLAGD